MDTPDSHLYVAGHLSEYLAITGGKTNDIPVGILTFRPHVTAPRPFNLLISRTALLRMREDIDFLLKRSVSLKDGESPEVTLAEVEAIHKRLG